MADETIRSLQERHNKLVKDAQDLHASRTEDGGEWTGEDQASFDKYMSEASDLRQSIDAREARIEALRTSNEFIEMEPSPDVPRQATPKFDEVRDPEERRAVISRAVNKGLRNLFHPYDDSIPREDLSELEREAVRATRLHYPPDAELRAAQQSVGTSSAGGVLVATEWQAQVLSQMKVYGGMRRVARILQTGTGGNLNLPISDDTGNVATIIGEATTGGTTHVPFGLVTLEAAKYKSGPIKLSLEILQDSIIDVEAYVRERIAERFGRATEAHFATRSSTESTGPHGIINDSTGAVSVSGTSTALSFDTLIDLYHAIDPAYRDRPSCAWMLNDATLALVSKLKDTTGQYLWRPGLAGPNPNSFLGKQFIVNQDIPSFVTAGTSTYPKFLFFGDWSHYAIRDVMPLSLFRFNERYLNEGNFGVIGFGRFDGRATFASTTPANKPIRCAIQST